ncbi:U-box domain-containing protein 6 [Phtheirospermum japonicum]|uniref:RING-type E3 ubiquitin transferase n=1 Tax=Phtheirospermum japonicum TaxID=374723 RepID=A0A830CUU5_9LAMI|nr:U-box domain-containing protein 6 [Phtheirospermum japonicum]
MGNHDYEDEEGQQSAQTFKVHNRMCSELLKLVTSVSRIFPEIEEARPRCSSGIEALCSLNNGLVKAKSLLQHCSESSVLYLALTGDAILSRCKKSRNLLEESLIQIQNMVPVMLAAKISGISADIKSTAFCLDPSDEEGGRVLRELLHRYGSTPDSTEESALAAIHNVSSLLRISSQKSLLIEKRSIRKLLDKFGENERSKKKILSLFLKLLNKYGKVGNPFPFVEYRPNESRTDDLSGPAPPEEFICPLSSKLMCDPVVIGSGQTYERGWIQKWFEEGHDFCPKTNTKLAHFSFTPNTAMKGIIVKWCTANGMSVPEPKSREAGFKWSKMSMNSIASLSSSINDLNLPLDLSNVSLGSSNDLNPEHEIVDMVLFSEFSTLSWETRCNAVEDVKRLLRRNDESLSVVPPGKLVHLILGFLKDAQGLRDTDAQMSGCLLLFEFLQKHGNIVPYLNEDAYELLASFLDTKVSKQALSIFEALSFDQHCGCKISASGALTGISNVLDRQIQELLEPALKILSNLSSTSNISSFIVPSELIPKLIPLFDTLGRHCVTILKNLCENRDARVCIAETDGCIASIVKMLERDDHEEQEGALDLLLCLCAHSVEYCRLVSMDEGVFPCLFIILVNGNANTKAMATELMRILRDELSSGGGENSGANVGVESTDGRKDENPAKGSALFGKLFSKPGVKKKK